MYLPQHAPMPKVHIYAGPSGRLPSVQVSGQALRDLGEETVSGNSVDSRLFDLLWPILNKCPLEAHESPH